MDFKKLDLDIHQYSAPHKFASKPTELDSSYLEMSDWLSDLCYYYMTKRKNLDTHMQEEFHQLVTCKREKILNLKPSLRKDGLLKAVDNLLLSSSFK